MSDYQNPAHLAVVPELLALATAEARTFLAFNHNAVRADGVVPRKYRELIALGEIAEAAFVAAAVRAGDTLAHALLSLRLYDSPKK
jgi:hypothetical protein